MKTKAIPALVLTLAGFPFFAGPASADRAYSVPEGINVLSSSSRQIGNFVKSHYPEARTHAFEKVIHFEHGTGLHILPAIVKSPNPPKAAVRGPLAGGVWGDIAVMDGALDDNPAYARAEGGIDRGEFTEYRYYIAPPLESDHHLIVTVRLPRDAGEKNEKFIEELREALKEFRIDRQTLMPSPR